MAYDARAQAPQSLAGCYDLHLGEWGPGPLPGVDSLYMALPPRIRLDTLASQGWMSRDGAFQAGPAPGAMPSVHDIVNWEPVAGDSIRMIWSTGFSGVVLVLAHQEDVLVGRAESFWDTPRAHQHADARALAVSCTAPLPEGWVIHYRLPRGILLASGDSLRIGEPMPEDVPTEAERPRHLRLLTSPAGPFAGASQVEVALDEDGRVRTIRIMFPDGTDYAALVARVRDALGEPTSTDRYLSNEMTSWFTRLLFVSLSRTTYEGGTSVTAVFSDPRS